MYLATSRVQGVTMSRSETRAHPSPGESPSESPGDSPGGQSDAALISRVRAGDATAYEPLCERHVAAASALARRLVDGEGAAEDAVAETFIKILGALRRGGGPQAGFRTYLLVALRRTVHDRARGR